MDLAGMSCFFHRDGDDHHYLCHQEFVGRARWCGTSVRLASPLRLLENRVQAKDHPILMQVPETAYLKCLIVGV